MMLLYGLPLTCLLVSLAYMPQLIGAATVPRWAILSAAIPMLLFSIRIKMTPAHWLLVAVLTWAGASLLWSEIPADWITGMWELLLLAGCFCLGGAVKELSTTYKTAAWTILLFHFPLTVAQQLGFQGVLQAVSPASTFINANILAEFCAVIAVAMLYLRAWWLLPAPVYCVFATGERASLVALAVIAIYFILPRAFSSLGARKRWAVALCFVPAVFLSGAVWQTYHGGHGISSITERAAIWHDTVRGMVWKGHGIGSFSAILPKYEQKTNSIKLRADFAHNEPLHFFFELGVGAVFLLLVFGYALGSAAQPERAILMATGIIALFAFPFHMATTAFFGALAAGYLSVHRIAVRDPIVASRMAVACFIWGTGYGGREGVQTTRSFLAVSPGPYVAPAASGIGGGNV